MSIKKKGLLNGNIMFNLGNRIMNSWIYPIQEGYVLIDTGYENEYTNFKKRLAALNLDVSEIKYIFLTHAHDDHAGFLNDILEESQSTKIVMSYKSLDTLYKGQNSFVGGCTTRLALFDTPSHTADSISLILNDGAFFCGDAAMNGFPSLNRITIWAEDKNDFSKSWQTIICMKPKKIYPAHGKPFDYEELINNNERLKNIVLYPLHIVN